MPLFTGLPDIDTNRSYTPTGSTTPVKCTADSMAYQCFRDVTDSITGYTFFYTNKETSIMKILCPLYYGEVIPDPVLPFVEPYTAYQ